VKLKFEHAVITAIALLCGFLIYGSYLSGIPASKRTKCSDGSDHKMSRWSESQYIQPNLATNEFLGLPINTTRIQARHCEKCNLEERRAVE